jgi:hypothetical protein
MRGVFLAPWRSAIAHLVASSSIASASRSSTSKDAVLNQVQQSTIDYAVVEDMLLQLPRLHRSFPRCESAVNERILQVRFPFVLHLDVHAVVLPRSNVIDVVPLGEHDVDRLVLYRPPHLRPHVAGLGLGKLRHGPHVAFEVLDVGGFGEAEPQVDEDRHPWSLRASCSSASDRLPRVETCVRTQSRGVGTRALTAA